MRKMSTKKLQIIHSVITEYDRENKDMVFNIPSLIQYCIENDIRKLLEEKKVRLNDINCVLESIKFNVCFKQLNTNRNAVKLRLNYRDFYSFENCYMRLSW